MGGLAWGESKVAYALDKYGKQWNSLDGHWRVKRSG